MAHYFDTSALVKLFISEAETPALVAWIEDRQPVVVTSDLTRTELPRAIRRLDPALVAKARQLLDSLDVFVLKPSDFNRAGSLEPVHLRSLDAIHIVAAKELGDELDGIVTYDDRLAEAARLHGLPVISPG